MDLVLLQYKFNKQNSTEIVRVKHKGHQKPLISNVRFLSQFISVQRAFRHPGNIKKNKHALWVFKTY